MRRVALLLVLASIPAGTVICTGVWAQMPYRITDLGYGYAVDVNNAGDIAGVTMSGPYGEQVGCLWRNGTVISLGLFPDSMNNSGQIVGGRVWDNGTIITLPALPPYNSSYVYAMNDAGEAVGYSYNSGSSRYRACLWKDGTATGLQEIGGNYSVALHINNSGVAVGHATDSSYYYHACVWKDGNVTDLGKGYAVNINDNGQIVGISVDLGQGCIWENGIPTVLEGLDSQYRYSRPLDINNSGQIVGWCGYLVANSQLAKACIWQNGIVAELPCLPGYTQSQAVATNDSGRIVGFCYSTATGPRRAVVWEPIPEPSCLLVLVCRIGGLAGVLRRKCWD